MKNLLLATILILSSIYLSSCFSRIIVKVDAFDMAKMKESSEYQNQSHIIEQQQYAMLLNTDAFDTLKSNVLDISKAYLKSLKSNFKYDTSEANIEKSISFVFDSLNALTGSLFPKLNDVNNALNVFLKTNNLDDKRKYDLAFEAYNQEKSKMLEYLNSLGGALSEYSSLQNPNLVSQLQGQIDAVAANTGITTTFGTSITNDKMESFVVKAPEPYWEKYKTEFYENGNEDKETNAPARINSTKVSTKIGNSDIAIKMDQPGSFTIKGVRLDADQAFRTSFKVLSQGIKYLTYAAGIPNVPASGSSSTPAAQIPELGNLEKNKTLASSLTTQYQTLMDTYAKVLDSYSVELKLPPTDPKRKAAIVAIQQAFNYLKSQLPTQ